MDFSRRSFGLAVGAAAASTALNRVAFANAKPRVVVIGGGAGGATVARYIAKDSPDVDVTLVEQQKTYTTCFYSNLYLGGFRSFESITHSYAKLKDAFGVNVVNAMATAVDADAKMVTLADGTKLGYDKLVLSPGIDFRWDLIEGYDENVANLIPHAYKAGVQTQTLKRQLLEMEDGGTVVISAPPNPYRCPPGPYERTSMIAHYLKYHKPASKLLVMDPKDKFSKMGLFQEAWNKYYGDIVEWVPAEFGGTVTAVDAKEMTVTNGDGETIAADVINIIPGQKAGKIAQLAGATNESGWCPINPDGFASTILPDVHVLGDSSIAASMPKSGFSANSQAKVVANTIRAELTDSRKFPARFRNTCWSLVAINDNVKVGASYVAGAEKVEVVDKFISSTGEDASVREANYAEANGWYAGITTDMFG